ncbi:DNA-3-methyladenine glycosylase [Nonlabens agnitus]|uniref:Putative 3-methyladenine DNA glycosylase n=1 Tax=Nonlabens agnitus TaxID=870484 RepID=A0A2S9WRU1_9FLAO|nr:DNA-3-methyladenine glycosylase [Nonlabens agnitus]PRP66169.1 3-methyladenine DNA glycosylase [Nonlabens agnitus]
MSTTKLPASYYQHDDVVFLAKDLIGKTIVSMVDDQRTSAIITETEAYRGVGDKACHAHLGRFTDRTKIMYETGGVAYVYLCYGIHNLFNIITNTNEQADAILIRAVEPVDGIDVMLARRGKSTVDKTLTSGPGNFSKAFGLDRSHYGADLTGDTVWIASTPITSTPLSDLASTPLNYRSEQITTSKRIGIDYAEEDKDLPWRFYLNTSKFVSKR